MLWQAERLAVLSHLRAATPGQRHGAGNEAHHHCRDGAKATAVSTFCVKCGKSAELVRGDGATFARNTMAIEVKGKLACSHAARPFITSWSQWAEWEATHAA